MFKKHDLAKNLVYQEHQPKISRKIKNVLRTCPVSDLENN